jgi:hypothetical protein
MLAAAPGGIPGVNAPRNDLYRRPDPPKPAPKRTAEDYSVNSQKRRPSFVTLRDRGLFGGDGFAGFDVIEAGAGVVVGQELAGGLRLDRVVECF